MLWIRYVRVYHYYGNFYNGESNPSVLMTSRIRTRGNVLILQSTLGECHRKHVYFQNVNTIILAINPSR